MTNHTFRKVKLLSYHLLQGLGGNICYCTETMDSSMWQPNQVKGGQAGGKRDWINSRVTEVIWAKQDLWFQALQNETVRKTFTSTHISGCQPAVKHVVSERRLIAFIQLQFKVCLMLIRVRESPLIEYKFYGYWKHCGRECNCFVKAFSMINATMNMCYNSNYMRLWCKYEDQCQTLP